VDGCALARTSAPGREDRRTAYPERPRRVARIRIFFGLMFKPTSFVLGLGACRADTRRVPTTV